MDTAGSSGERAGAPGDVVPDCVIRASHPPTGLTMDVPSEWTILASTRTDGPLQFFGLTLLPRVMRESAKRPYQPGMEWNTLLVQAAPEAGLSLSLHDGPLTVTLESVLNDPFYAATGTKIMRDEPELRIGPFSGFGVIRALPRSMQIRSNFALSAPAMSHQIWLEGPDLFLEIQGYALEGQPEIQNAIEAMIASLKLAGDPTFWHW